MINLTPQMAYSGDEITYIGTNNPYLRQFHATFHDFTVVDVKKRSMKMLFVALVAMFPLLAQAQDEIPEKGKEGGTLQLGLRSTASLFSDDGYAGYGVGGQFRLRLGKKLNTEWFADYLFTDFGGAGRRADGHIGWSVMFYPGYHENMKIIPYFLAGHCFDYTKVTPYNSMTQVRTDLAQSRWSSATQAGLGVHWQVSPRFDFSFSGQYMIHLGKDLHYHIEEVNGEKVLLMEDGHGNSMLEGHLLFTLSMNVRIADLW